MSHKSASIALQTAIYGRLTAEITTTPVYDYVPENVSLPYIVIGEEYGSKDDTKTFNGENTTATIHVWSQGKGFNEVKTISGQVIEAITKSRLDLSASNFSVRHIPEITKQFITDMDGQTKHGTITFRFTIQEKT